MLDFVDFDRRFELKINEASEDLIAKKEQGKCSCTVLNVSSVLIIHVLTTEPFNPSETDKKL